MKNLRKFQTFDAKTMFENMELVALKSSVLYDFNDKEKTKPLGAKYKVIIFEDRNDYGMDSNGKRKENNIGESLDVKVLGKEPVDVSEGPPISLENPEGKIYGDYGEKLSVSADDIIFK